ncbi:hypothetical protein QQ73_16860 [Candidatus Endoriftia persephone str. Guaymas]|jgi:hypothetical protein|uniref:Uncharacterized protein n=2 Tax=Gammaproteobacteria TaxID=1236 RepID=G2FHG3_9GAMM|nr:hypothetical protein [Candidatus Endoriftia persephone]EGW53723.1 hypothetical protein TevJSym_av00070 [endosymbiont of Tevnia jerichonana (vent Tica)]MBA1332676.1 hypothetical protein [Candidatus Endoriftia persephone str. Guaymas]USF86423.1 hypothetical protein L0Y14_09735 [Candidatus Endoriftia persephone]
MQRPSKDEIKIALRMAEKVREREGVGAPLARYLLYLHHRNERLESIYEHLERYLRFGQPENEHARLICLIEELREESRKETEENGGEFGLE